MFTSCNSCFATDFGLLEMLIAAHKNQSNKLAEKNGLDGSLLLLGSSERSKSEEYEELCKNMGKRMSDVLSYATFAADMVSIATLTKDVILLEEKAISYSVKYGVASPKIALKAIELQQEFKIMTEDIANLTIFTVTSGVGVAMATQEQRKQFIDFIYTRLYSMKRRISNFLFYSRALSFCEKPSSLEYLRDGYGFLNSLISEEKKEDIMDKIKKRFTKNQID